MVVNAEPRDMSGHYRPAGNFESGKIGQRWTEPNLFNVRWNRFQTPEKKETVYVYNLGSARDWSAPSPVTMTTTQQLMMERYLNDLRTTKQDTIGDIQQRQGKTDDFIWLRKFTSYDVDGRKPCPYPTGASRIEHTPRFDNILELAENSDTGTTSSIVSSRVTLIPENADCSRSSNSSQADLNQKSSSSKMRIEKAIERAKKLRKEKGDIGEDVILMSKEHALDRAQRLKKKQEEKNERKIELMKLQETTYVKKTHLKDKSESYLNVVSDVNVGTKDSNGQILDMFAVFLDDIRKDLRKLDRVFEERIKEKNNFDNIIETDKEKTDTAEVMLLLDIYDENEKLEQLYAEEDTSDQSKTKKGKTMANDKLDQQRLRVETIRRIKKKKDSLLVLKNEVGNMYKGDIFALKAYIKTLRTEAETIKEERNKFIKYCISNDNEWQKSLEEGEKMTKEEVKEAKRIDSLLTRTSNDMRLEKIACAKKVEKKEKIRYHKMTKATKEILRKTRQDFYTHMEIRRETAKSRDDIVTLHTKRELVREPMSTDTAKCIKKQNKKWKHLHKQYDKIENRNKKKQMRKANWQKRVQRLKLCSSRCRFKISNCIPERRPIRFYRKMQNLAGRLSLEMLMLRLSASEKIRRCKQSLAVVKKRGLNSRPIVLLRKKCGYVKNRASKMKNRVKLVLRKHGKRLHKGMKRIGRQADTSLNKCYNSYKSAVNPKPCKTRYVFNFKKFVFTTEVRGKNRVARFFNGLYLAVRFRNARVWRPTPVWFNVPVLVGFGKNKELVLKGKLQSLAKSDSELFELLNEIEQRNESPEVDKKRTPQLYQPYEYYLNLLPSKKLRTMMNETLSQMTMQDLPGGESIGNVSSTSPQFWEYIVNKTLSHMTMQDLFREESMGSVNSLSPRFWEQKPQKRKRGEPKMITSSSDSVVSESEKKQHTRGKEAKRKRGDSKHTRGKEAKRKGGKSKHTLGKEAKRKVGKRPRIVATKQGIKKAFRGSHHESSSSSLQGAPRRRFKKSKQSKDSNKDERKKKSFVKNVLGVFTPRKGKKRGPKASKGKKQRKLHKSKDSQQKQHTSIEKQHSSKEPKGRVEKDAKIPVQDVLWLLRSRKRRKLGQKASKKNSPLSKGFFGIFRSKKKKAGRSKDAIERPSKRKHRNKEKLKISKDSPKESPHRKSTEESPKDDDGTSRSSSSSQEDKERKERSRSREAIFRSPKTSKGDEQSTSPHRKSTEEGSRDDDETSCSSSSSQEDNGRKERSQEGIFRSPNTTKGNEQKKRHKSKDSEQTLHTRIEKHHSSKRPKGSGEKKKIPVQDILWLMRSRKRRKLGTKASKETSSLSKGPKKKKSGRSKDAIERPSKRKRRNKENIKRSKNSPQESPHRKSTEESPKDDDEISSSSSSSQEDNERNQRSRSREAIFRSPKTSKGDEQSKRHKSKDSEQTLHTRREEQHRSKKPKGRDEKKTKIPVQDILWLLRSRKHRKLGPKASKEKSPLSKSFIGIFRSKKKKTGRFEDAKERPSKRKHRNKEKLKRFKDSPKESPHRKSTEESPKDDDGTSRSSSSSQEDKERKERSRSREAIFRSPKTSKGDEQSNRPKSKDSEQKQQQRIEKQHISKKSKGRDEKDTKIPVQDVLWLLRSRKHRKLGAITSKENSPLSKSPLSKGFIGTFRSKKKKAGRSNDAKERPNKRKRGNKEEIGRSKDSPKESPHRKNTEESPKDGDGTSRSSSSSREDKERKEWSTSRETMFLSPKTSKGTEQSKRPKSKDSEQKQHTSIEKQHRSKKPKGRVEKDTKVPVQDVLWLLRSRKHRKLGPIASKDAKERPNKRKRRNKEKVEISEDLAHRKSTEESPRDDDGTVSSGSSSQEDKERKERSRSREAIFGSPKTSKGDEQSKRHKSKDSEQTLHTRIEKQHRSKEPKGRVEKNTKIPVQDVLWLLRSRKHRKLGPIASTDAKERPNKHKHRNKEQIKISEDLPKKSPHRKSTDESPRGYDETSNSSSSSREDKERKEWSTSREAMFLSPKTSKGTEQSKRPKSKDSEQKQHTRIEKQHRAKRPKGRDEKDTKIPVQDVLWLLRSRKHRKLGPIAPKDANERPNISKSRSQEKNKISEDLPKKSPHRKNTEESPRDDDQTLSSRSSSQEDKERKERSRSREAIFRSPNTSKGNEQSKRDKSKDSEQTLHTRTKKQHRSKEPKGRDEKNTKIPVQDFLWLLRSRKHRKLGPIASKENSTLSKSPLSKGSSGIVQSKKKTDSTNPQPHPSSNISSRPRETAIGFSSTPHQSAASESSSWTSLDSSPRMEDTRNPKSRGEAKSCDKRGTLRDKTKKFFRRLKKPSVDDSIKKDIDKMTGSSKNDTPKKK